MGLVAVQTITDIRINALAKHSILIEELQDNFKQNVVG